jgi:hypothetical protein
MQLYLCYVEKNPLDQKHYGFRKHWIIPILIVMLLALSSLSPSVFAADQVFVPGAYIIDMGRSPQTVANGLKPYGLIYDLMRNAQVPVYWAIRPGKLKDGVDFTADGKDCRGGSIIISAEFAADAIATINQGGGFIWAACHAVSALENVDDPGDPDTDPDMNFLSEHSLVLWGDHGDGTPPYLYNDSDHPIMQFQGTYKICRVNSMSVHDNMLI